LVEGTFIENIPGFSMKINQVSGENQDQLADVFTHKTGKFDDDKQTIISKKGTLRRDKEDIRLLKMELFDGYIYTDAINGKSSLERRNQPNHSIKFDTMNLFIDISEILQKAMDEENISDHYRFLNASKLKHRIDSMTIEYQKYFDKVYTGNIAKNIYGSNDWKEKQPLEKDSLPVKMETLKPEAQKSMINEALISVEREMESYKWTGDEIRGRTKLQAKQ